MISINESFLKRGWGWIPIYVASATSKVLTLEEDGKRMAIELLIEKSTDKREKFFWQNFQKWW